MKLPLPHGDIKRLSEALVVNRKTIYNWMSGRTTPSRFARNAIRQIRPDLTLPSDNKGAADKDTGDEHGRVPT